MDKIQSSYLDESRTMPWPQYNVARKLEPLEAGKRIRWPNPIDHQPPRVYDGVVKKRGDRDERIELFSREF